MRISSQKFMQWMLRNNWEDDMGAFRPIDEEWITFEEWCKELDLLEDE